MSQRLFLLDGMALVYRAHFAFAARPIRTSAGLNTSALFGFTTTLLDILQKGAPTHVAVAFDTDAPTPRHEAFPEYKAQRQVMPEELSAALPHLRRIIEAFRIPVLILDGYEADDLIGTLAKRAEQEGFETFMVTPDKDFGQLVTDRTQLWKPGRQGSDVEIMGPEEVCSRWGIARVELVIDMLGLMGDTSDNIPGVPGVGEKTAAKLLTQYGTLEGVLENAGQIKGKLGEALRAHAETARLSKQLATIITDVPIDIRLEDLALQPRNDDGIRSICIEFEFNTLGRRLLGDAFRAGRGTPPASAVPPVSTSTAPVPASGPSAQGDLFSGTPSGKSRNRSVAATPATGPVEGEATASGGEVEAPLGAQRILRVLSESPHDYRVLEKPAEQKHLAEEFSRSPAFAFSVLTHGSDPKTAAIVGLAFSLNPGTGWFLPAGDSRDKTSALLQNLAPLFTDKRIIKVGHNLKSDILVLRWHGLEVQGPYFDTMIAHSLIEPELRHGLDYLSESILGYTPISLERLLGPKGPEQKHLGDISRGDMEDYSTERADLSWQLYLALLSKLREYGQERVFFEVEMPVLPAIAAMEFEGVQLDSEALAEYSRGLAQEMAGAEGDIHRLAGRTFNVNSNRQLGEVLFDQLRLVEKPKKTPSGQYATDEQTLLSLATEHEIVRRLLDHRAVAKLKSTYADALPAAIFARTGRVHTTYSQAATATGRLSSTDPNLQNIPIRTDRGQEIRRAFVARPGWRLLSADYSQIELRIIAALSEEKEMIEAFRRNEDIHTSTAARVFGVRGSDVTAEMRRRAKMVNFGIAYGISAFGLAQRLGIPRGEAALIISHYFQSYPGIRRYMDDTIASARAKGYVETLTGRRRYLRDVNSANATIRGAAERNAINAPIQGTAADMIKVAMARIHEAIMEASLKTRLLLQVHDELVFDLYPPEESQVRALVEEKMRTALPLPGDVPIVVEVGTGSNWLEAH